MVAGQSGFPTRPRHKALRFTNTVTYSPGHSQRHETAIFPRVNVIPKYVTEFTNRGTWFVGRFSRGFRNECAIARIRGRTLRSDYRCAVADGRVEPGHGVVRMIYRPKNRGGRFSMNAVRPSL